MKKHLGRSYMVKRFVFLSNTPGGKAVSPQLRNDLRKSKVTLDLRPCKVEGQQAATKAEIVCGEASRQSNLQSL